MGLEGGWRENIDVGWEGQMLSKEFRLCINALVRLVLYCDLRVGMAEAGLRLAVEVSSVNRILPSPANMLMVRRQTGFEVGVVLGQSWVESVLMGHWGRSGLSPL